MTNTAISHRQPAENVKLPLPPEMSDADELEIYTRFMRHLLHVPNSKLEIKILSAIQFTADILDHSDAHVAKLLVELGLKAPRMAFPADFLSYADAALMRNEWDVGGPTKSLQKLKSFWDGIGEDKFAAFKRDYPLHSEDVFV